MHCLKGKTAYSWSADEGFFKYDVSTIHAPSHPWISSCEEASDYAAKYYKLFRN